MFWRPNIVEDILQNIYASLARAEMIAEHDMQFTDGGILIRNRDLDDSLGSAQEQMEVVEELIREMHLMGQPVETYHRRLLQLYDQMHAIDNAMSTPRIYNGSGWDEYTKRISTKTLNEIRQQRRKMERLDWGFDAASVEQQITNHRKRHKEIVDYRWELDKIKADLRQMERVDRGFDAACVEQQIKQGKFHNAITDYRWELDKIKADMKKVMIYQLEEEYDGLLKASFERMNQLCQLQNIFKAISRELMWINEREEEELVYDWSDKNRDIPKKQEAFSKLMSQLEVKEKELNKLKFESDQLILSQHPAADNIEAYMDTLQTQWSWIIQITKCIDVHLKENLAYFQFFDEAQSTESYLTNLQDTIRKKYPCDKSMPLQRVLEMIKDLEKEWEKINEHKRHVQNLVNKSKKIIQLKPRNPDYRRDKPIVLKALCDYKQHQKVIHKGDECILKNNSQRSKWNVTGPGGLVMVVPSVSLIIPPPNPEAVDLSSKIEQSYEAILVLWNQLYNNMKSLVSWHYWITDIQKIRAMTLAKLKTRQEDYQKVVSDLELHYREFMKNSQGSNMFDDEEKREMQNQFSEAQNHYQKLVDQIPDRKKHKLEYHLELQKIRQQLEIYEMRILQRNIYNVDHETLRALSGRIADLEAMNGEGQRLSTQIRRIEKIILNLKASDKSLYLQSELYVLIKKMENIQDFSRNHSERLQALTNLIQSILQLEDLIKAYEARLTEEETISLDPAKREAYRNTLKKIKAELDQKKSQLKAVDSDLNTALQINDHACQTYPHCEVDISKFSNKANQLKERWQRIEKEIHDRSCELEKKGKQLRNYRDMYHTLSRWIGDTNHKQDVLESCNLTNSSSVARYLNEQKSLNIEIQGKRDNLEEVVKMADQCVSSIKDYELQLASYSSGLETLFNIPIKRTMVQSPSKIIMKEYAEVQARYIELLTRGNDYYRLLHKMSKSMEDLKMKNTRIELLEEELCLTMDANSDNSQKNTYLSQNLQKCQHDCSEYKSRILLLEDMKRKAEMEVSSAKRNLEKCSSQITELNEKITRFTYEIDDEKRRRKALEDRCDLQKKEFDEKLQRMNTELDEINRQKKETEKIIKEKEYDIEKLRLLLQDEGQRKRDYENELSKIRKKYSDEISSLRNKYESEIHIKNTTIQQITVQKEKEIYELRSQLEELAGENRDHTQENTKLNETIVKTNEQCRRAEEDISQKIVLISEISQKKQYLETELQKLKRSLEEASRTIQDRNNEIDKLKYQLQEEAARQRQNENELIKVRNNYDEQIIKYKTDINNANKTIHKITVEKEGLNDQIENLTRENWNLSTEVNILKMSQTQMTNNLKKTEDDFHQNKSFVSELIQRKQQLETELRQLNLFKTEEEQKHKKSLDDAAKTIQEQNKQIERLKIELIEVETDQKIKLEKEHDKLQRTQFELEKANSKLKIQEQELIRFKSDLEKLSTEKQGRENEISTLQINLKELQTLNNKHEEEINRQKRIASDEHKKNKKIEEELEALRRGNSEQLKKITILTQQRESLDGQLRDQQRNIDELSKLVAEVESLRRQLHVEQENLRQAHIRNEHLQKTIEERNRSLNESKIKIERQQSITENLTKDHLRLEEELRNVRCKDEVDGEKNATIPESKNQLQISIKRTLELQKERQHLKQETEKFQKLEATSKIQESSSKYSEIYQEKKSLLPVMKKGLSFQGIRQQVSLNELVESGIIRSTTVDQLESGQISVEEVSEGIKVFLQGSSCIAGIYNEATKEKFGIYDAMKKGLLRPATALELLEAQAATGFIVDPVNNIRLPVEEAYRRGLVGIEFKEKLLSAERAVTGYKDPETGNIISLFQAMNKELMEKEHGIRLLEAQIATGGIIDPKASHRLPVDVAYKRGYFNEEMNAILSDPDNDTKGFFDPNTEENLTYLQLKERCMVDPKTNLCLLPLKENKMLVQASQKKTSRKRRVVIVDPDTNREMTVQEAYNKGLIDNERYIDLLEQECEWEEITTTGSDGSGSGN